MNQKARLFVLMVITVLSLSGCVQETSEGTSRIFTYEFWVPLSVLFGGIIAAPIGWVLRKYNARMGWGILIVGPIAAIFIAPSLFRDRAVVSDAEFSLRTGIWGLTAVHNVKYDGLTQVRITSEEVTGRRGAKRTNYFFVCERNNGAADKVPVNNQISQAAAPFFLQRMTERGIPVRDESTN